MTPAEGREEDARWLNEELVTFYRQQDGCIGSHFVVAADGAGEQGRVSFWQSERHADAAAVLDHSLYLRSRLHLAVRDGHQQRSFTTELTAAVTSF